MTEAGPCRTPGAGPVQPRTSRRPWCRQVSRQSVAANEIACSSASRCSGAGLGARQPGIDQDGQVLLVLLLELLDHQLAAPGRRPPVDPARAVARAVIAQPVVFHLLRRAVVPLAAPVFGRLPLHLKPAAGQMADLGINDDLVGQRDRDPMLDQAERRPGAQIEIAKPILAAPGARALPADPRAIAAGDPGEEDPRRQRSTAPATERSTGTRESSMNTARAAYQRRPFSSV